MLVLVAQSPFAAGGNLVAGVGAVGNVGQWANFSAINVIAGATLLPAVSKQTVLYIAFTAGTTADVANMVLYKTAARQSTILSVTPVKLGGISNPSISLTSKTVCKTQPISATNPCIVRLDPLALSLSPTNDYYFVIYFTSDSNNSALGGASPVTPTSSLTGWYASGDDTQLKVGDPVPTGGPSSPYFLVAVQSS
jgi:hypothetical protein